MGIRIEEVEQTCPDVDLKRWNDLEKVDYSFIFCRLDVMDLIPDKNIFYLKARG